MSGIFGLFNQDGAPALESELAQMASLLERRGPDGTGLWTEGPAGLGHTLLATTPEAARERLPLAHPASGCTITADARLDNRDELLAAMGTSERAEPVGDAELILCAYLAWGQACVERLLGDFAFAINDPGRHALFCARDHMGVRPFNYHHTAGRFFVFASEPRAILVLEKVPFAINEGRIADFLVSELEGIDKTSTFFQEVYRLPPAHTLTVTPEGLRLRHYWRLEPGPQLRLPSDEAYAEAFLEVFTEAVRCRLRSAGPVGSMLSGGVDSGSVVAVARGLLAEEGKGPLATFSGVGPNPSTCVETRTIQAAMTMEGIDPHTVAYDQLGELQPELEQLTWDGDEPFDSHMTLVRAMYLLAHRQGRKMLLDGAAGDVVLTEGSHLARLLRRGRWLTAWREARGVARFWGEAYPAWRTLYQGARTALAPNAARRLRNRLLGARRARVLAARRIRESLIHPELARRVDLAERLETLAGSGASSVLLPYAIERARAIEHPYLTVARERYDRVASALAVEPRDPFLDRRVACFCVALPGEQRLAQGWPKMVLRRAVAGLLPDAVRWRAGKEHLGWSFTRAVMERMRDRLLAETEQNWGLISPYVDMTRARKLCASHFGGATLDDAEVEVVYEVANVGSWLRRRTKRPARR